MSESFKKESRRDWFGNGPAENLAIEQLALGCLQRIADATELMAKEHDRLVKQRDEARNSREYWMAEYDAMKRSRNALRGQVTRLQAKLEKANAQQS